MLLRDNIYRAIRHSILTCEYGPGQDLREQVLADFYHVSRSPIRDSLLRLEQENLVTVLPRQGYRVNDISLADVEDIYGLRLLIEPACAAGAARREDAAAASLDRFRDFAGEGRIDEPFIEYNQAFHAAVNDLSGNVRLTAVAHDVIAQFDRLLRISVREDQLTRIDHVVREHDALIDAVQAHDAVAAARLAYEHVNGGRVRVLAALRLGNAIKPNGVLQTNGSTNGSNGATQSCGSNGSHGSNGSNGSNGSHGMHTNNSAGVYRSASSEAS